MPKSWNEIKKKPAPEALKEARLQLHYAMQILAAAGDLLAEPQEDSSHQSAFFDPDWNAFSGEPLKKAGDQRLLLLADSMELLLISPGGKAGGEAKGSESARYTLINGSLEDALKWAGTQLGSTLKVPAYSDFPEHELMGGSRFKLTEEIKTLAAYFRLGNSSLNLIAAQELNTREIRIWPHHFDMATLSSLPDDLYIPDAAIGLGLSPGDASFNEPYWYVYAWPYPPQEKLRDFTGGAFWNTKGFTAAVYRASDFLKNADPKQAMEIFLMNAVRQCESFLLK